MKLSASNSNATFSAPPSDVNVCVLSETSYILVMVPVYPVFDPVNAAVLETIKSFATPADPVTPILDIP